MRRINPALQVDGYKLSHPFQYPPGIEMVYSNFTPRNSRRDDGDDFVVAFGFQFFLMEYLVDQWNTGFFQRPKDEVLREYKRRIDNYTGPLPSYDHIAALHDLGYLPIKVKAVREGQLVPYGVPMLTIQSTNSEFAWVTNMLETIMSSVLWKPVTSATTAFKFRREFIAAAKATGGDLDFTKIQGHDFSFRGMCGIEDASLSGAAHLLSFIGTDTVPAIDFLEYYYGADCEKEVIGISVPATEHSVMCAGGLSTDDETETFRRLAQDVYPTGFVSVVSDSRDLWNVLTTILPSLQDVIEHRDGKLVIRPDSGDPVLILLGDPDAEPGSPASKGVIQLLWDTFGGTVNEAGFKVLADCIGVIYGDGINRDRQKRILWGLMDRGFCSSNIVLGLGSYTYQFVTRDTDGQAMKATAVIINGVLREIWKDPVTDSGLKKSHVGLLRVDEREDGRLEVRQKVSWAEEAGGFLETIYLDGEITRITTLAQIRELVESQL